LQTARDIELTGDVTGTVSFDGSQNVQISTTIAASAVDNNMLANSGISLTVDGGAADSVSLGESINFVSGANITITASADNQITIASSGTFSGNADTASTLQTARDIELTGDVTGTVSFDGSQNVQIATTIAASISTNVTGNITTTDLTLSGTQVTATGAELNYLDVTSAGTTQASKAWVSDASNDITHGGNIVLNGANKNIEIQNGNLDVSGSVTAGNIEVTASVGSISSTNLKIKDSLVELNFEGSTVSGTRDIGIFGRLDPTNGGNTNVVGLFYDGSDSTWKATYGSTPANTNYVNSITSYKPIMAQNFIPAGVRVDAGATVTTTNSDDTIILTHNAPTVTLHNAGNIDGQRITLVGDVGGGHTATINGAVDSITLTNHSSVTVVRANSSWYIVSKYTSV
jgi:hypothetical protein